MNGEQKLIMGTRGSPLALRQAEWVKQQLQQMYPALEFELRVIRTQGDKILDAALSKIGGKGLFTREIEQKLLDGSVSRRLRAR